MIRIEIDNPPVVAALERLARATTDLKPVMQDIGEALVVSTKRRFTTSTAPDGSPWPDNSDTTVLLLLRRRGGLSKHKTKGGGRNLTRKGVGLLADKKPLIGESRRLGREIHARATAVEVVIASGLEYAAVQQFGAKARSFAGGKSPWGDIPARPFLGVSRQDEGTILDVVRDRLTDALKTAI